MSNGFLAIKAGHRYRTKMARRCQPPRMVSKDVLDLFRRHGVALGDTVESRLVLRHPNDFQPPSILTEIFLPDHSQLSDSPHAQHELLKNADIQFGPTILFGMELHAHGEPVVHGAFDGFDHALWAAGGHGETISKSSMSLFSAHRDDRHVWRVAAASRGLYLSRHRRANPSFRGHFP